LATKGLAVAQQQHAISHISHLLFLPENFWTKQHDCPSPPTLLSSFSRLKLKLKGRHFDTNGVIEAEFLAVLNTLTEHDFQDTFENWQKHWEGCICVEGA
jgi:hypothetical protein